MEIVNEEDSESNWESVIDCINHGFNKCFILWDVPMGEDEKLDKSCLLLSNPRIHARLMDIVGKNNLAYEYLYELLKVKYESLAFRHGFRASGQRRYHDTIVIVNVKDFVYLRELDETIMSRIMEDFVDISDNRPIISLQFNADQDLNAIQFRNIASIKKYALQAQQEIARLNEIISKLQVDMFDMSQGSSSLLKRFKATKNSPATRSHKADALGDFTDRYQRIRAITGIKDTIELFAGTPAKKASISSAVIQDLTNDHSAPAGIVAMGTAMSDFIEIFGKALQIKTLFYRTGHTEESLLPVWRMVLCAICPSNASDVKAVCAQLNMKHGSKFIKRAIVMRQALNKDKGKFMDNGMWEREAGAFSDDIYKFLNEYIGLLKLPVKSTRSNKHDELVICAIRSAWLACSEVSPNMNDSLRFVTADGDVTYIQKHQFYQRIEDVQAYMLKEFNKQISISFIHKHRPFYVVKGKLIFYPTNNTFNI